MPLNALGSCTHRGFASRRTAPEDSCFAFCLDLVCRLSRLLINLHELIRRLHYLYGGTITAPTSCCRVFHQRRACFPRERSIPETRRADPVGGGGHFAPAKLRLRHLLEPSAPRRKHGCQWVRENLNKLGESTSRLSEKFRIYTEFGY